MAILKVLTAPDPILSSKALTINEVDDQVRKIMDDMLETMYAENGIGLAANQIGILKRILVLDLKDDDEEQKPAGFYPLFMANPEITEISDKKIEATEGCLSVPEQKIDVTRPSSLKVKYLDYNNIPQELNARGWLARAIQHEMDHLDGTLLLDYISLLKKSTIIRKLQKIKKIST